MRNHIKEYKQEENGKYIVVRTGDEIITNK